MMKAIGIVGLIFAILFGITALDNHFSSGDRVAAVIGAVLFTAMAVVSFGF